MASDLFSAMNAASTGMRAQTVRIRLAAENVANASSTGDTPGADPYRRTNAGISPTIWTASPAFAA